MENNERIVPEINFQHWYVVNQASVNGDENRHKSVITLIIKNYFDYTSKNQLNEIQIPYFIGNTEEIKTLSDISYNGLEDLIIKNIRDFNFNMSKDLDLLKIFDLIQIWGGLFGGSNPYNLRNGNMPTRLNLNWIEDYKKCAKQASNGDIAVYENIIDIPELGLSFGSKHISFWSRKNGNDNCLVVIDNKIAGTTGNSKPRKDIIKKIVNGIHYYANIKQFEPQQIEKALFTFHAHYFDNSNSKFTGIEKKGDMDYAVAVAVAEKLGIDGNSNNKKDSNNKPSGQIKSNKIKILKLPKSECIKTKTDIFISAVYVEKNKHKLSKYVNMTKNANIKGKNYFILKEGLSSIKFL
jgi:hypothetical protein